MTAVAAQHRVDMTQADLYTTEGYATFDLLANPQLTEELRLNVALYNLTNQAYIEWADVRGRTATDPLVPYYTRAGFNAAVTLHWQF